ncbi:MAG: IS66 family transposase [Chloroflexia bacterium]
MASMTAEEEVLVLRAEVAALKGQLAQALALIAQLRAEIEQLRSSPPTFVKPSTPKPKEKAQKQPRRKRAKDQNGARLREQSPTHTIQHHLETCPDCAYPLQHPQLASKRQVIELPPPVPVQVTEHQLYKGWCPRCSRWHYPPLDLAGLAGHGKGQEQEPAQVIGHSRIGVRIASVIAYLRTTLRMPVRLIREYLHTIHNLLISTGEIGDLLHRVAEAERVKQAAHEIKEVIRHSSVVHADETGWREGGQNGYIWCLCTPEGERYYEYDHSRAGAVARRILGSQFKGTLVSDFYGGYNEFPGEHQRCWVHLLRDLHTLKEDHKENEEVLEWAAQVRAMYDTAHQYLHSMHSEHGPPSQQEREVQYNHLMDSVRELGSKYSKYSKTKSHAAHPCHTLSKRLLRHQDELFTFVLQEGVSSDNNLAERSVRPVVVMRKVSGGTQSAKGSATRMTLATLFGTWRAKGLNPFHECLSLLSQPSHP